MITVEDFERYATDHLPRSVYNHVSAGSNDQQTLNDNRSAFKRYRIRPRVLRDVSRRDLSATILGHEFPLPIGIAPTGLQRLAYSDGDLAMARAASSHGVIMILSSYATSSIEDVASAASPAGHLWFQLYIFSDRRHTEQLVRRAERAGYNAIVVTVDTPYAGKKYNDERCGFNPKVRLPNVEGGYFNSSVSSGTPDKYDSSEISPSVTWADIQWLRSLTELPVIVKGIISGENALEAVANNVDGIIVSNHGGRQLDGVPAPIDVLPEVLAATKGTKVEVYMDGGIRQGTDVMKALALGARAVFIGRPAWWGLTYKGEEGVQQVLQILRDELDLALALSGCASVRDLNPSMVVLGPDVAEARL
ncbi:hydroxyacid oxidase 1-like [Patiria miniata]|uniref:(S)-2-hydroxy-acid oxidase n=1 Tax=Patiria miniata TaxID=46514 RepID=A0A914BDN3_PATMI|nr:hydroxyacid oxidase 1-like [Patiria miniata]XP_038074167.1 hydroxyacid oxidase 1-like [Patiria miniata]XP_038074168.1 hydroxyacid oxidase 1-like [Patiria miniata]XP_038074169.1 hydroxyacid oxidase 1-like [Patiria miniata]XP_038074170.1 hydroxyacid oxidase 1-like [Patiria miniata]